ncbi:MAG: OsmC family peroxiredoxin, partial [Gemmatimonadales bacterium]
MHPSTIRTIEEEFMATRQRTERNGIDLDLLRGYVAGMTPGAAITTARLYHRWEGGFHVHGRLEELEEQGRVELRTKHTLRTDWPEPISGDRGPTPGLEMLLAAVAGCAATTCIAKAALRGVEIRSLEVTTEGRVDLSGIFEVGVEPAWPGLRDVRVTFHIDSPSDDETLDALRANVERTSPSLNS